jgi:hypothetical protein
MGASKKWITPQNLEADKCKRNGLDLSALGNIEYENHPFQPRPLASLNESEHGNTAHAEASARVANLNLHRDLRLFDRDSSRRILAH